MNRIFIASLLWVFTIVSAQGQKSNDINQSIICEVIFSSDGYITASWRGKSDSEGYNVKYRIDHTSRWNIEALDVQDTFYTFTNKWDVPVELLIETNSGKYATGYVYAAHEYFKKDVEEKMLILVEASLNPSIEDLIEEYQQVLSQELIETEIEIFDESDRPTDVKTVILNRNQEKPIDYILILGHVAVPYSGNSAIDGHTPDHEGAWVAEGYYGDIDGQWTDTSVNNAAARREENQNIPGDGKFDQNFFPSPVDIPVGRVDFSDLPKLNESEAELTRNYLRRNIDYRLGKIKAPRRAVIDNNFNLSEGVGQGAIKSFHTFLEPDSINYGDYDQCLENDYLFTYGAGSGGYQSASNVISTNTLVQDSVRSIFTTVFGSYFGDWDVSNNLLRAILARGNTLINAWSGRPVWHFHQMAMGESVGSILLNSQNAITYHTVHGKLRIHISLLGDPSLKMYYHEQVRDVELGNTEITWSSNGSDPELVGYNVYYNQGQGWDLLTESMISETKLDLSLIPHHGQTDILIRPVALIQSRSGSYYNEGNGAMLEVILSSTEDIEVENVIFPNPVEDVLNIKSTSTIKNIQVFNMSGQLIMKTEAAKNIDVSALTPGMYTLFLDAKAHLFVKD